MLDHLVAVLNLSQGAWWEDHWGEEGGLKKESKGKHNTFHRDIYCPFPPSKGDEIFIGSIVRSFKVDHLIFQRDEGCWVQLEDANTSPDSPGHEQDYEKAVAKLLSDGWVPGLPNAA
ncbi:MAG: hypothetical protein WC824_13600 [Bacteroidota bacterium]|jgi:hypothetical protein